MIEELRQEIDDMYVRRAAMEARAALAQPEPNAPPPLVHPPYNIIVECGGPCEQDFRLCTCGLLQQLNPALASAEQQARDMLERMGFEEAQDVSAERLIELANLIAGSRQHGATHPCPYIRSSDEGTSYCALAEQAAPTAEGSLSVAPLLWVLWHHLGSNSPVGQPIREYLGMGQYQPMSKEQVESAKKWRPA